VDKIFFHFLFFTDLITTYKQDIVL